MLEQGPYNIIIGCDEVTSMLEQGPYNIIIGGDFNARTGTLQYNNRR